MAAASQGVKNEVEGDRPSASPISIFLSYAHTDKKHKDGLVAALAALRALGRIREWHDAKILASEEWEGAINESLDSAGIILLLISADYLASEYCWKEMMRALERSGSGESAVIPIILRPVDFWEAMPFGRLQALPEGAKPITTWRNRDSAWKSVAQGIRKLVYG